MKNFDKAIKFAFLLLKYRARSINEMRSRLKVRGYSLALRNEVVAYLLDCNYLNDEEFARSYINSAFASGWGPCKIDYKLKNFGISDGLRQHCVKNIDFSSKIKEIVLKKIETCKSRDPAIPKNVLYRKVTRFLAGRGFSHQDISLKIQEALDSL